MSTTADSEDASAADAATGLGPDSGSGAASEGVTDPSAVPPEAPAGASATTSVRPSSAGLVFDDPLDRPSSDDTDRGWGDTAPGSADDDFTRFLSEKPPHHL